MFVRTNQANSNNKGKGDKATRNNVGTYIHFAYGKDLDVPTNITIGSSVDIVGHVEGHVVQNDVWGGSSYLQYMVADKIKKASTQLEAAFPGICDGKGFAILAPCINAYFMGEITNIKKSNHDGDNSGSSRVWTRLRLKVGGSDARPSVVEMQYSSNMRVNDVEIKVGDTVCVSALVISTQKITKGNTVPRSFEDIIVNDIAVIESVEQKLEEEDMKDLFA